MNLLKRGFFLLFLLAGMLEGAEPLLRVGLMTDTHVTRQLSSCQWVGRAWELFKAEKVDMVVNLGDIADYFYSRGYRNYRATVNKVFPDKRTRPQEVYIYANHDRIGRERNAGKRDIMEVFREVRSLLEIPNEPTDRIVKNGCVFLIFPQFRDPEKYEAAIAGAVKEFPGKPIFVLDHGPGYDTVENSRTWGNGATRKVLNKFPQVIQLSGHVHSSLFSELNIWQGEYTAVNLGCLQNWGGDLSGSTPARKAAREVAVMDVYEDKVVFRRFSLLDGKEYRPENRWTIPLPFDPATAPYNLQRRLANSQAPEFPAGAKITITPDRIPFLNASLNFTPAAPDVYKYIIGIEKNTGKEQWQQISAKEIFSNFYLGNAADGKDIAAVLSGGFFEPAGTYRIRVTPVNFFGKTGKALSVIWQVPAKVTGTVVFESTDPMNDKRVPFLSGLKNGRIFRRADGFYIHDKFNGRLVVPPEIWNAPAGTHFRCIVDMHTVQPGPGRWTMVWRNSTTVRNAHGRLYSHGGDFRSRYVMDFRLQKNHKLYLLIREGKTGRIRFEYIRIERLND